jgi:hypothetical protein
LIAQTAAYIRQCRMEVPIYIDIFREYERTQIPYQCKGILVVANKRQVSRAGMTTWKINVDKINRENPDSIQLLELLCLLGPEEIPERLIKDAPLFKNRQSSLSFTDALIPLINFAHLRRLECSNYRMHTHVSFCVRVQIDSKYNLREKQERLKRAVASVYHNLPRRVRMICRSAPDFYHMQWHFRSIPVVSM